MEVTLASADLLARGRLEGAAATAGVGLSVVGPTQLLEELRRHVPRILILDLDAGGPALLELLERARGEGLGPERVVGFFSHVDDDLGRAATQAGVEAFPRGRFWREAATLLRPPGPDSSLE